MTVAIRLRTALTAVLFTAAILVAATGAGAKTTGVDDDPALQSGPCYDALVDKNAAAPTTAPNRELGSACAAEQGDVDKAWARVIRLWGSDSADVPDYDNYQVAPPTDGALPLWLAIAGLILSYAVLGTPIRAAARLLGGARGAAGGEIAATATALALRAVIAGLALAAYGVPGVRAACAAALIIWLAVGRWLVPSHERPRPDETPARPLAIVLAATINDALGAAAGLAALMLCVQHSLSLFIVALALALVASAAPVIAGRRSLRATRLGAAVLSALLAGVIAAAAVLTPPVAGWVGSGAVALLVPLVLAVLTFAAGWSAEAIPFGRPDQGSYKGEGGRL